MNLGNLSFSHRLASLKGMNPRFGKLETKPQAELLMRAKSNTLPLLEKVLPLSMHACLKCLVLGVYNSGASGSLGCLLARTLCLEDSACNQILQVIPRVCGLELGKQTISTHTMYNVKLTSMLIRLGQSRLISSILRSIADTNTHYTIPNGFIFYLWLLAQLASLTLVIRKTLTVH